MGLVSERARPDGPIDRSEALRRARVVAQVARAHAERAENLRELPPENVQALVDSELAMLLVPSHWGGFALDWETTGDCVCEVAKACGSTGWCLSFLMAHNWLLALFPEEAQRAVYARDPQPRLFTTAAPEGRVREVPGGYVVNGEWGWASGSHHSQWGVVGALLHGEGPPTFLNLLIDPGTFEILDDWHHFGLKGTGSSTIRLTDVFVPAAHAVVRADLDEGHAPGRTINPGLAFRLPLMPAYALGILAPMLGVARGALQDFAAFTRNKLSTMTGEKVAEQAPLQARLGEAAARIDAADTLLRDKARRLDLEPIPDAAERVRFKRDYLFAGQLLLEGIDILMNAAGARGGRSDNPMQRHFRDAHAMAQHVLFSFDVSYASAGRMLMGMGPDPRDII